MTFDSVQITPVSLIPKRSSCSYPNSQRPLCFSSHSIKCTHALSTAPTPPQAVHVPCVSWLPPGKTPCSWADHARRANHPQLLSSVPALLRVPLPQPQQWLPSSSATSALVQHPVTWIRDLPQLKRKNPPEPPELPTRAGAEYTVKSYNSINLSLPFSHCINKRCSPFKVFSYKAKFGSSWAIWSIDFLEAGPAGTLADTTNRKVNFEPFINFI